MRKNTLRSLLASNLLFAALASSGCGADGMTMPTPPNPTMPDPTMPTTPTVSADSKFRPSPNGFSFQNLLKPSQTFPSGALGVDEMRRLFGDQACASMVGGCTLTPAVEKFRSIANKDLDGGLCEGFSILANIFYAGTNGIKPSDFQAGATSTFDLKITGNPKLERELVYWMVTQYLFTTPAGLTPSELADQLVKALAKGANPDLPTVGFYKSDGKGNKSDGHAMNAYAIDSNADGYSVKIYDNNYPNKERILTINTKKDTWSYSGATNSTSTEDLYLGDAASKTIELVPLSARLQTFPCDSCADKVPNTMPAKSRMVAMSGPGHMLVTDASGKRVGYSGGSYVNEIAGSEIRRVRAGTLGRPDHAPAYNLPAGTDLTINIDGSDLSASAPTTLGLFGAGYTLDVEGIDLAPGQVDTVAVNAMGTSMVYTTQKMESPTLVVGFQAAGDDFEIELRVTGDTTGQMVTLTLDQAAGSLKVQVDGHDTADYDIELVMHRIGVRGDERFSHVKDTNINIASGGNFVIKYGNWAGNGNVVYLEVDTNRDGTPDRGVGLGDDD